MALNKPKTSTKETATENTVEETQASETSQAPEVNEEVAQATPSTEVATTSEQATAMAHSTGSVNTGSLEKQLAEDGFEGMEVGFHSFMTVRLPTDGIFATQEDEEIGKEFDVYLLASKAKYLFANGDDDKDDEHVLYTYDKITSTSGDDVQATLDEWKAEGINISEKKYLDVQAEFAEGEFEGELAMLSISPASVQKLTGYMGKLRRRGINPRETVTQVFAADKVKTKAGQQFYPWGFRLK